MLRKEIAQMVAIPEVIHGIANLVFDGKALPVMMISVGIIGSTTPKRINAFRLALSAKPQRQGPLSTTTGTETIPISFTRIRSAIKPDINATCAELVFGTTLRLPSDILTSKVDYRTNRYLCIKIQSTNAIYKSYSQRLDTRFTINLQKGAAQYPPPDVAFHFDPRFFNRSVVRNTRSSGVWASEETYISHFPFQPGVSFDLVIRVEADRYSVSLNGQHFIDFGHRLRPLEIFDTLYIENDVSISAIRFS
ncbi:Galectin-4 like protein [Argiope bruennichi]|uniref:Galectin n=1 Tax=Argiope bruennichi TaxID=94029 RepID=A0A8T0EY87_ARGBR|nr:Galectin-4 like protein [Argiope bruennichi]